jgi:hypothetical protein
LLFEFASSKKEKFKSFLIFSKIFFKTVENAIF